MGGRSLDAETGETAAGDVLNSLSKRNEVNALEGCSVSGGREEEGRRRSRLTPRLSADSGQMVLGEVGDLGEAEWRGGLGMGGRIHSPEGSVQCLPRTPGYT